MGIDACHGKLSGGGEAWHTAESRIVDGIVTAAGVEKRAR